MPGRYRQVISHTCGEPKVRTQQSVTQTITAAMHMLCSFTRPFLLISLSEGECGRLSTIEIKMSPCGLCYALILYSSLWKERHSFCLMETNYMFSLYFLSLKKVLCKCSRSPYRYVLYTHCKQRYGVIHSHTKSMQSILCFSESSRLFLNIAHK